MPIEILIVAYYAKALHNNIAIWVKRSKKNTFLEAFEEASQIEKDILSLKDNLSSEVETTSSSKKKIEILTRPPCWLRFVVIDVKPWRKPYSTKVG